MCELYDRDQLYFDRFHATAPIIHKKRYLTWANQETPSLARMGLRSAMRTIAAAMSAQHGGRCEYLCVETRRLLDAIASVTVSGPSATEIQLEEIQSWLLLAHYEILRGEGYQAMLTAGRAFRLVQLSRLYEVDACTSESTPPYYGGSESSSEMHLMTSNDFAEIEEKRRTFWLAFCLDRFLSMRHEWPLTLQEDLVSRQTLHTSIPEILSDRATMSQKIFTRLPAPEPNFQNCQPSRMDFLYEVTSDHPRSPLWSFAECVVLAALYGRCMIHRRWSLSLRSSNKEPHEFWNRHDRLSLAVENRRQLLSHQSPDITNFIENDPMAMFAQMLAHATVIYLFDLTELVPWQSGDHHRQPGRELQQAHQAARDMACIAKSAPRFMCFKV